MGGLKAEHGEKSKGCLNRRGAVINTAKEYSAESSIHGISYIFDQSQGMVSRFAWLLIVMSAVTLGVYWSLKVRLCMVLYTYVFINLIFNCCKKRLILTGKTIKY